MTSDDTVTRKKLFHVINQLLFIHSKEWNLFVQIF